MKKFIVFFAAIAMVGAFAFSAVAADWSFYGSSRLTTVSYDRSKEVATYTGTGSQYDDQDTTWKSQTNARLGANVAAGDVTGRFEFQTGQAVGLRLMYGEWNFGSGKLLVGQDYTPGDTIISASIGTRPDQLTGTAAGTGGPGRNEMTDGEGNALWIGSMYTSRLAQIKLKFGAFQIAFIEPNVSLHSGAVFTESDTTLPKIEMAYTFKTDMFSVKPYAGYNTYDGVNATDQDYEIESYIYGAQFGVNFGAAYVKGNIYGAQNASNYGKVNAVSFDKANWNAATNSFNDADEYGGILLAGFKLSDMLTFEAGYAMVETEVNNSAAVKCEGDAAHWYINAIVTLAPGVTITPEIGKFDLGDNVVGGVSTKNGDVAYFGAKWQINF
ncbi:MAG: hypothetical protein H8E62_03610 [Planctomycetes bacterium]|nr:hypothetical protein [Planctomycetota bacterium]